MATALDSVLKINMPSLPITERLTKDIPNEKLAPISTGDMAAGMQERRAAEAGLRQEALRAESDILKAEQEQKVAGLESKQANLQKEATELAAMPERQTLKDTQESLKNAAFVPSKENAQEIATFFSLMGIVGMAIGGGAKDNAYAAMAGMNGMLEGYKKGRADIYKRERDMFDKNFKALQTKVQIARDELADAVMLKTKNFEAGRVAEEVAIAKTGSPILEAKLKKQGSLEALKMLDEVSADLNSLDKRKNDLYKQEQDRQFKEKELQQQERLRLAQMAQTKALAELKGTPSGIKMPAKLQEAYIADNQLRVDISSLKNQLQDPQLVQQIKQYGVESFLSEEGGKAISQVMQRQMPDKLAKFLTEVRDMRNNYYLTISGKAVTGGEALRNYGVVPQPGDSQQQMLNKLDGMERRVGQKINAIRGLYNAPDISGSLSPGSPTMVNPNENYSVRTSEQPAAGGGATQRPSFASEAAADAAFKAGSIQDGTPINVGGRNATYRVR